VHRLGEVRAHRRGALDQLLVAKMSIIARPAAQLAGCALYV
jgi:hypothetical protein